MSTDTAHERLPDPGGGSTLGPWADQARAFATRYLRELVRNKAVLFWTIVFPVGFYLLTITIFMDTSEIPEGAIPYVKSGTAITYGTFGAIIAALNSFGQQLAMDLEDERYRLYRALPVAPSADLFGRMAAGTVLAGVAMLVVLAVAVFTGGTFTLASGASIPVVTVAFVAFAVFWMAVAVLITTAVRDTRYASIITVSLALALYFLTGYNGGDPSVFGGPDVWLNWLPNTLPTRLIVAEIAAAPAEFAEPGTLEAPDRVVGTITTLGYGVVAVLVAAVGMRRLIYRRGVWP